MQDSDDPLENRDDRTVRLSGPRFTSFQFFLHVSERQSFGNITCPAKDIGLRVQGTGKVDIQQWSRNNARQEEPHGMPGEPGKGRGAADGTAGRYRPALRQRREGGVIRHRVPILEESKDRIEGCCPGSGYAAAFLMDWKG